MISPYTVETPTKEYKLKAITMTDPAKGWFEVKNIPDATANECMKVSDDVWLS